MVTGDVLAFYDLTIIKRLANLKSITYRSRKVGNDIANLGYDLNEVSNCIMKLTEGDFVKTYDREERSHDDEYRYCNVRYNEELDENSNDDLYIKFCLTGDYLEIDLGSFHLRQY